MAPQRAGVFLASIRLRIPASRNRRVIVLLGLLGLVKVISWMIPGWADSATAPMA
jgi:hypothetical protein